jgi:Flp pilus assembly protein TadD
VALQTVAERAAEPRSETTSFSRRLRILLCLLALAYALLAGLRTLTELDLGWQLATGRWIAQHHRIPFTDVLSYTAQGRPWIYPVGSQLLFYALYRLGGYALLSWLGAIVCAGTIAVLLRRASAITAALAILAVPLIAARSGPRADMFSVLLFSVFLSVLWQYRQTGQARLWMLPVFMIAWVNLHLGLAAGLGLLGAYVLAECLDLPWPARRQAALLRLRRSWPWMLATFAASLVNPWGWRVYAQMLGFMAPMAKATQDLSIAEWIPQKLNWASAVALRNPDFYLWLLIAVVGAIPIALWRKHLGEAAILAGAAYVSARHVRLEGMFAAVAVVIAGSVLSSAWRAWEPRIFDALRWDARSRRIVAVGLSSLVVLLTCVWSADVVSDRTHLSATETADFGAGLSWWFPEGAANFIERENIPGRIFNTYNEGGYIAWRLGPQRLDYVDGRGDPFGPELIAHAGSLMATLPDSPEWQAEADRYGIDAIIVPLGRYDALQFFPLLRQFCASETWRPVYLDEVSAVFVRRLPETEALIQRLQIDCATAPLPSTSPARTGSRAFNQWANAAALLSALGRSSEAFAATTNALAIFPDSAYVHFVRGQLFAQSGRLQDAESQFLLAAALAPKAVIWSNLAAMYEREGRTGEAIAAWEHVVALSSDRYLPLLSIGFDYLTENRPQDALQAFDRSEASAPANMKQDPALRSNLAHGRAMAWKTLGNYPQAISLEEQTVRLSPDRAEDWIELAGLYEHEGRIAEAQQARERAAAVSAGQPNSSSR